MKRLPAVRAFSTEINSTKKFEDLTLVDKKVSVGISPLGRKIGRIFHVGVLIETREEDNIIIARITDKYGGYTAIAHAVFQPNAYLALKNLSPPTIVAVVGRLKMREDFTRAFVRLEYIAKVSEKELVQWEKEAFEKTKETIEALEKNKEKMNNLKSLYEKEIEKIKALIKEGEKKDLKEEKEMEEEISEEDYTFDLGDLIKNKLF